MLRVSDDVGQEVQALCLRCGYKVVEFGVHEHLIAYIHALWKMQAASVSESTLGPPVAGTRYHSVEHVDARRP